MMLQYVCVYKYIYIYILFIFIYLIIYHISYKIFHFIVSQSLHIFYEIHYSQMDVPLNDWSIICICEGRNFIHGSARPRDCSRRLSSPHVHAFLFYTPLKIKESEKIMDEIWRHHVKNVIAVWFLTALDGFAGVSITGPHPSGYY